MAAASALAPGPAMAQADISWRVSKSGDQCLLARTVAGTQPTMLAISSQAGSETFSLFVGIPKLPRRLEAGTTVNILLSSVDKAIARPGQPRRIDAFDSILVDGVTPSDLKAFATATSLHLEYRSVQVGPFPLPDMAEAVAALQECLDHQLTALGADKAQFVPGGSPPIALKAREQFLTVDQMRKALGAGLTRGSGTSFDLTFKLEIDTNGNVAACAPLTSTGNGGTKMICEALSRQSLFRPAHDAAGKAVTGIATYRMQLFARPEAR